MARPPKAIITRRRAAEAALAEIEEHGLHGFGLAHVATRLGVKAPSLYHHFSNKDELLAEAARLLLVEGRLPEAVAGLDWREEVVRISCFSRRAVLRHPKAAALLLRFFPRQVLMGAYERWAHVYSLNDVPAEWRAIVLEGSEKLTFGSALFAAAAETEGIDPDPHGSSVQFPFLTEAQNSNPLDDEQVFIACMRAFLNGLPLDRPPEESGGHKPNGI